MRITVETLQAGQLRAYADTTRHVRITFEHKDWKAPHDWLPREITEEEVRAIAPHLKCGWTDFDYTKAEHSMENYFRTRLDWLRKVSKGVWEFHTTSAYTD